MLPTIFFLSTIQAFKFLSNFAKCSIYFLGKYFPTLEHAYQYGKCFVLIDDDGTKRIYRPPGECQIEPWEAKRIGDNAAPKLPVPSAKYRKFSRIRWLLMLHLTMLKYSQNDDFKALLLDTGNALLVEASTNSYWGAGKSKRQLDIDARFSGQNVLGCILMQVRAYLRGEIKLFDKLFVGDSLCRDIPFNTNRIQIVYWPGAQISQVFRMLKVVCHPDVSACAILVGTNNLQVDRPYIPGGPRQDVDGTNLRGDPKRPAKVYKAALSKFLANKTNFECIVCGLAPRFNDCPRNGNRPKSRLQDGVNEFNSRLTQMVDDLKQTNFSGAVHYFDTYKLLNDPKCFKTDRLGDSDLHLNAHGQLLLGVALEGFILPGDELPGV